MKYQIEWIENKVSAKGNKYASTSLKDDQGKVMDVTIFSSFPNFATLKPGDSIEGELKSQDYKGNITYTLEAVNIQPRAFSAKPGAIKEAMATKRQDIAVFQGNKELSIKIASTFSMAVNITLAMIKDQPVQDEGVTRATIERWRKWLWENWDKEDKDYDPFPSNDNY